MKLSRLIVVLGGTLVLGSLSLAAQKKSGPPHWVGIWATAASWRPPEAGSPPTAPPLVPSTAAVPQIAAAPPAGRGAPPPPQFNGQTLRQIIHTTFGGDRLRVVFSNVFGTAAMSIGGAGIALRDKDSAIVAGSARPLMFSGQPTTIIPAG